MHASHWWLWLYVVCWLPYAACLVLYGFRSPWRSSWVGRGLFAGYAAITGVLTLVLISSVASIPNEVRHSLIAAGLGAVSLAGFVQLANVIRLQKERTRPPGDRPTHD